MVYLIKNVFNIFPNKFITSILVLTTLLLTGCGAGGGSTESKTGTLAPSSIAITPATATVAKGQITHFAARATYTDGSTADITNKVTWASANATIATVDTASGSATGVVVGSTTVSATLQGITSPNAALIVTAAALTGITISPTTQSTFQGMSITYTATAAYSDNSSGNISGSVAWKSSNTAVATLNSSGIASTLAQGSAAISASVNGITSNIATLSVATPVLATLSISPSPANITVLGTKKFTASGVLTDGTPAVLSNLTWKSSNPAVATVDNATGVATGVSTGSCVITTSSGSFTSASATLNVNNGNLMGGAIQGYNLTLTTAVTTLAGSGSSGSVDGTGTAATFGTTQGIATDGKYLFVVDREYRKIRKIDIASGVVTTLAGSGVQGVSDGTGILASFAAPIGVTSDGINLFVVESSYNIIRKIVISSGVVTTLAGTSGTPGAADGTGTSASFNYPWGITTDGINLYVADGLNQSIRKIVIATGVVTTLAGPSAGIIIPQGIATDGINLYVTDIGNNNIRKIVIASGVVTTLAGKAGSPGSADGTGTLASFNGPVGLTTDGSSLYVTDTGNYKIRKVVIASGVVTTLAGTGAAGSVDSTGTIASFFVPQDITTDGNNLYVSDFGNRKIRKIQ